MANLSQISANYCGIKLSRKAPEIPSSFIPVPQNYIVLSLSTDEDAKKYPHYNIVLDLLVAHLQNLGINIVQIGESNDPQLRHSLDFRGKTFRQNCWIVEHARAVISNDSHICYVAGYKKVPLVCPISADHAEVAKPHYIGEHIYIESHREGRKPSYGLPSSDISLIKPEEVAQAILSVLKIGIKIGLETIKIGADFYLEQIDFTCDYPIEADIFNNKKIICRMDLNYNSQALAQCLYFYKAGIITSKPISSQILQKFKDKIYFLMVLIEKDYSKGFIEEVHRSGIPYTLCSELEGRDLTDAKLDLLDFNPILTKKPVKTDFLKKDLQFRTNRVFLSNQKIYASPYHWKIGKQYNGSDELVGDAIADKEFHDCLESFHLFRLK